MKAPKRDRVGATRGKLALVGVLAVVLVYVLASNFGGGASADAAPSAEAAAQEQAAPALEAAAPVTVAGGSPFGEFVEDRDWPKASLDKLLSFDPLGAPPWMAVVEREDIGSGESDATSLEELRNAASAIIFIADGQRVARIGSQDYRVGDLVGPYQITEITSAGIVLGEPTPGR
jgi:hypothetical protein